MRVNGEDVRDVKIEGLKVFYLFEEGPPICFEFRPEQREIAKKMYREIAHLLNKPLD